MHGNTFLICYINYFTKKANTQANNDSVARKFSIKKDGLKNSAKFTVRTRAGFSFSLTF